MKVEKCKKGEYYQKKLGAKKVFEFVGYCRYNKAYEFSDVSNISESIYKKKGSEMFLAIDDNIIDKACGW